MNFGFVHLVYWSFAFTVIFLLLDQRLIAPPGNRVTHPSERLPPPSPRARKPTGPTLEPLHERKIQEQLAYWRFQPFTFPTDGGEADQVAHFRFEPHQVTLLNPKGTQVDGNMDKLNTVLSMFKILIREHLNEEDVGDLFVCAGDIYDPHRTIPYPHLVWNTFTQDYAQGPIIFPDPYWLQAMLDQKNPHSLTEDQFAFDTIPWAQKIPQLHFAGKGMTNRTRRLLHEKYKHHPHLHIQLITSQRVTWAEQRKYKYMLYLDGYAASWNRLDSQLRSHSVSFVQTDFTVFTTYGLSPHVEYLPFIMENDESLHQIKRLEENPGTAEHMIQAANDYAKTYNTPLQTRLYMTAVVKNMLAMFRSKKF